MTAKISGQCACGVITYSCTTEPKFSAMCQCRQCQRITGAGHTAGFAVDAGATKIIGDVQRHQLTSDQGSSVESAFCGTCGNPIYKTTSAMPDTYVFHAATLDDPSQYVPQMVVHSDSAQPWDHIDPTVNRNG